MNDIPTPDRLSLREHDVVRYEPPTTWCHDGQAIATRRADGTLVLIDTYWMSGTPVATPEAYEVLFNLDDYEQVPEYRWERFAAADRRVLRRQSSCYRSHYVRKGAAESGDQIVANAREALAEAEREVESAVRRRDWCRDDLDKLLASGGAA